jgi:hypothetical protein
VGLVSNNSFIIGIATFLRRHSVPTSMCTAVSEHCIGCGASYRASRSTPICKQDFTSRKQYSDNCSEDRVIPSHHFPPSLVP